MARACLEKAFCKMCVTICGRFCPDEGVVAGYDNRIRAKYSAKWGVQIAGMLFQTCSRVYFVKEDISMEIPVVIVYMIGQKYIVGGMTSGAVKE